MGAKCVSYPLFLGMILNIELILLSGVNQGKIFPFAAEFMLADKQLACDELNDPAIVSLDTFDGCKKAVHDLDVVNPEVINENIESEPKGCYVYTAENKLYFNEHPRGLPKSQWTDSTRKVCFDWDAAMEKTKGNISKSCSSMKYYYRII